MVVSLGSAKPPFNRIIPVFTAEPEQVEFENALNVTSPVGVTPAPDTVALPCTGVPTAADVITAWLPSWISMATVGVAWLISAVVVAVVEDS
jgi:hypothetical protein